MRFGRIFYEPRVLMEKIEKWKIEMQCLPLRLYGMGYKGKALSVVYPVVTDGGLAGSSQQVGSQCGHGSVLGADVGAYLDSQLMRLLFSAMRHPN